QIIRTREIRIRSKEVRAIILKGLKKYTKIKLNKIPPVISPILSVMYNSPDVNSLPSALITVSE
ncbi:unnamed protein product, partial [marine sediment metagenome]